MRSVHVWNLPLLSIHRLCGALITRCTIQTADNAEQLPMQLVYL